MTTTTYGNELGWIGMMLVHESCRRQGLATRLMQQSIQYLDERVSCIRLDATPAGRAVYRQLGFEDEWNFQRWLRPASHIAAVDVTADTGITSEQQLDPALDLEAFGVDRSAWLMQLAAVSRVVRSPSGFGMLRPGRLADYLGPVVARDEQAGERLVRELVNSAPARAIIWDVPRVNQHAEPLARRLGFAPIRELTRMVYGHPSPAGNPELQFAIAGLETG
ncbi:MAG: GNAT family N-acetyltransferase [Planctomycetales bacterium]|nr:GNAT family N-acetyltransferase [Planctomycetales bacterium]